MQDESDDEEMFVPRSRGGGGGPAASELGETSLDEEDVSRAAAPAAAAERWRDAEAVESLRDRFVTGAVLLACSCVFAKIFRDTSYICSDSPGSLSCPFRELGEFLNSLSNCAIRCLAGSAFSCARQETGRQRRRGRQRRPATSPRTSRKATCLAILRTWRPVCSYAFGPSSIAW